MENKFVTRNEYVLMSFDDVVCSLAPGILNILKTEPYRKYYEKRIDYSKFENLNNNQLNYFCVQRKHKNILDEVNIGGIEVDATLADIIIDHPELYDNSPPMTMIKTISILSNQSFIKRIYIHSDVYDENIARFIINKFSDIGTIVYASGNFKDVISKTEEQITLYVLDDASKVYDIVSAGKSMYSDILVANYGYNYTYDYEQKIPILNITDVNKLSKENVFRLNTFIPFDKDQLQLLE